MSVSAPGVAAGAGARSRVVATNTLVCLFPPALFAPELLPLFEAHFSSYGPVAAWTPLERLGRVLVVYDDVASATAARREMDGFVWEDDDDDADSRSREPSTGAAAPGEQSSPASSDAPSAARSTSVVPFQRRGVHALLSPSLTHFAPPSLPNRTSTCSSPPPAALRAFFGPSLSLPLASLHSTLLSVPALSRNFLISPPGSPPVGWEQTLEEAPNRSALPEHPDEEGGMAWGDELARALRYLSVSSNDDVDDDAQGGDAHLASNGIEQDDQSSPTTHTIVAAAAQAVGPSITVSTPPAPAEPSVGTATPPPAGAARITAVKATIESMLGRKKSFEDLGAPPPRVIIPTARPPTADEPAYLA
ncbi:hypothetical protein RQP46_000736 [Phenoliferia psychrophenolica]